MEDEKIIIDTGDDSLFPELPIELVLARRPRKVYAGMWGSAEIAAVAVSSMALLAAILVYLLIVVPSNREVAKNRSEADRLDVEVTSAKSKYGDITSTQDQVNKLLTSVDDFETRYLPPAATGQTAIYQRLNGLIAAYGLTNTTGPDYAPLEAADQKVANQTDEQRGREKFRSLFPGVYVTVTLEGSYQNLRRFIREIETGNEFVVISSIELEPSETEKKAPVGAPPPQMAVVRPSIDPKNPMAAVNDPGNPVMGAPVVAKPQVDKGKTHGEVVSLRLEMASYFRRLNYVPMAPPVVDAAK